MTQPPYPPAAPPPPPPSPPPSASADSNRTLMLVLSYLGPTALIPLLTDQSDPEVRWHAKHGIVLMVLSLVLLVIASGVAAVVPCIGCIVPAVVCIAVFALHGFGMYKALNGQRLVIPWVSEFADKF